MRRILFASLLLGLVACDDASGPNQPDVDFITIVPEFAQIEAGDSVQLDAIVLDEDGEEIDVDVDWASEDPDVASVDGRGRVIGHDGGLTTIVASAGGRVALADVFVSEPAPGEGFRIVPDSLKLTAGTHGRLEATMDGSVVEPDWSTSNASVVDIDEDGVVTALAAGTARIRAQHGAERDSVRVVVIAAGSAQDFGAAGSLDDFTIVAGTGADWFVEGGELIATGSPTQSLAVHDGTTIEDGWVEADIDCADDAGLVIRFQDEDNYYLLAIRDDATNTNGAFRNVELYRKVGGVFQEIAGEGEDVDWPRGAVRTVRLESQGSTFRVYVDGVLLAFGVDATWDEGGIGVRHHSENDEPSRVEYRELRWGTF